jgi:hypothetical protein
MAIIRNQHSFHANKTSGLRIFTDSAGTCQRSVPAEIPALIFPKLEPLPAAGTGECVNDYRGVVN